MGEVQTQAVNRAVKGLNLHVMKARARRKQQRELEGLNEYEEQIKIDVSGRAEEFPIWSTVYVDFETTFIDASVQRDTEYDRPHFTFGSVVLDGGPISLTGCVIGWDVTDRNEVVGCVISIGAAATDHGRIFSGELHARFQGYGMPADAYNGLAEQADQG